MVFIVIVLISILGYTNCYQQFHGIIHKKCGRFETISPSSHSKEAIPDVKKSF